MTDLHQGYGSPYVQGARSTSPKEVLFRLLSDNPQASKDELQDLFMQEFRSDPELSDVCGLICFLNAYVAWRNSRNQPPPPAPETPEQRTERREQTRTTITETVARIQRAMYDHVMLNGKKLGDCTGREVGREGGKFRKVARAVPPNKLVRDVLSEAKLKALLR